MLKGCINRKCVRVKGERDHNEEEDLFMGRRLNMKESKGIHNMVEVEIESVGV